GTQAAAWPSQPTAAGPAAAAWPDGQGEGGVRLEAPLLGRQADRQADRGGEGRPGEDVGLPARTADVAVLQPGSLPAAGRLPGGAGSAVAVRLAALRPALSGGAGVGGGAGAIGGAEADEGDGLRAAAGGEPSADEQSRRAAEPTAPLRGEGAVSLAEAEVGGALGGLAAGRMLAARHRSGCCGWGSKTVGRARSTAAGRQRQEKGGISGGDLREVSFLTDIWTLVYFTQPRMIPGEPSGTCA